MLPAITIAVIAALHFALVLIHPGYLGVDGGAYLDGLRRTMGGPDLGVGFPRPPLAPGYLLWPFVEVLGFDVGYKMWSALASLAPAVPAYLFARRIQPDLLPGSFPAWASMAPLFAAGFILLDLLHAEMLVTGALPLLAFGLLGVVWWAMAELADDTKARWSLPKAGVLAACLGLIPWVNQTTAGLAIVTIPVFFVALLYFSRGYNQGVGSPASNSSNRSLVSTHVGRMALPMIAGGAIALCALPWYLDVLPVSGVLNYPGPFIYLTPWTDSSWLQLVIAWHLGLYMIIKGGQPWLRALGVLVVLLGSLTIFLSTDETIINIFYRSRYLLAIPFFAGITWCVFAKWLPRLPEQWFKPAMGLSVAVVLMLATGYTFQFWNQSSYSDMVTEDTETALLLAASENDGKAIINNSFTLALWIAALNEVAAPHTWTWEPPPTWTETDRDVRCVLGWRPECNVASSAHRLNAGWVLLEKRFPYYNNRAPGVYKSPNVLEPWANLSDVPWLTLHYARGTTEIWKIDTLLAGRH